MKPIHFIRCYRRERDDGVRCGMWLMIQEAVGIFFHGDRKEIQSPRFNVSDLEKHLRICRDCQMIWMITLWKLR